MANPYFKDGKLNREPRKSPMVKKFVHGAKETIKQARWPRLHKA